jgi:NADH dehydrogenase (ubiquinone) 1 beta subcomplex subunit 9
MGSAVSMPVQRAAPFAPGLTHQQRVTRLYRHALRTARDWYVDLDLWLERSREIQAEFRRHKNVGPREAQILLNRGLDRLLELRHPEPYTAVYMPGGCAYQRNVPPPPELCERSLPPHSEMVR